jgi:hypothetical protein
MTLTNFFKFVFLALAVICNASCGSKNNAELNVNITGTPHAMEVSVDVGTCSKVEIFETHKDGVLAGSTCDTVKGNRKVSVRCVNTDLPAAYLEPFVEGKSTDFATFRGVCSLSAKEIVDENARAKGMNPVWGRNKEIK